MQERERQESGWTQAFHAHKETQNVQSTKEKIQKPAFMHLLKPSPQGRKDWFSLVSSFKIYMSAGP